MPDSIPLLYLEDVSIGYDSANIVTNINLSVPSNKRIAIAGQNGVGKSTLLNAIMGMTPKVTGYIYFAHQRIDNLRTHEISQLGIALVKQENSIFADLTVAEHFQLLTKNFDKKKLSEHLSCFPDLLKKKHIFGKNLSGGQRQQLAIALALATKPKLLLLDEPSANIQPSIVEDMIITLANISEQTGMSLLVAEQNFLVIDNLTERTYEIKSGKLTASAASSRPVANIQS